METIVYSANIGGYDMFNEPKNYDKNIRYILFTDNKYIKSNVWEICHIDFIDKSYDNRKKARFIKLNPHNLLPNHNISIWIDHNLTPNFNNVNDILNKNNFDTNIMQYNHRFRNCIYDEGNQVLIQKKEHNHIVKLQLEDYKSEGFPKNYGLFETGFMLRKNNEITNNFNEMWWNEVNTKSGRDQLSQMYICWKLNFKIDYFKIGKSVYENPYILSKDHLKKINY